MRFQILRYKPESQYVALNSNRIWIIDHQREISHAGQNGLIIRNGDSIRTGWFNPGIELYTISITIEHIIKIAKVIENNRPTEPAVKEWVKELILWWILK